MRLQLCHAWYRGVQCCQWQLALGFLAGIIESTVQQNAIIHSALITARGLYSDWQLTVVLMAEMADSTVQNHHRHMQCRDQRVREGWRVASGTSHLGRSS